MAGFKKLKFGAKQVHRHAGKGATEQVLPNRHALNTLTAGAPGSRSMSDYAKATPGPLAPAPDLNDFASADDYS
jgi:hypothetical protein